MVELNNPTVSDNTESGALNMVKLTIDNCEVVVPERTTILDAAKSVGIQIPTLCYLRDLNEIGGCRVPPPLQPVRAKASARTHVRNASTDFLNVVFMVSSFIERNP